MNRKHSFALGVLAFCVGGVAAAQAARKADSLEITEEEGNYVLTVPVSRLVMSIPKGGLERGRSTSGGATDSPRYFYFEDKASHLIASGWFEPDSEFPGIERVWKDETAAWKRKKLPEPQDVSFERSGSWNAIVYDMATPAGGNSHLRAHRLQAGTWIEIHLSLTGDASREERRGKLREFLSVVQVSEKKP